MIFLTRLFLSVAVLWAATLVGGCDRPKDEPGVVATVNGRPVTLGQLEFHQDLRGMGLVATENPTVDRLRRDYGRIMADLIIQELVLEDLAKAGLGVSEADVAGLEARVRADYPGDAFDRMLFEENIDPAQWRKSLVSRIALEKFVSSILNDRVKVDVQEAADYYKEHVADFKRPAMVTFRLVRGPDKKQVERALRDWEAGGTASGQAAPDAAVVREVRLPRDDVPGPWRDILGKLRPGQTSPVMEGKKEAVALVLVGETPAMVLDPAAAYPLVERVLLEKKRNEAFAAWLAGAVSAADVRVSSHLLRADAGLDSEVPSPDILEKEFPGVGDMDGEHAARLAVSDQMSKKFVERFPERSGQAAREGSGPPVAATAGDGGAPPASQALVPDMAPVLDQRILPDPGQSASDPDQAASRPGNGPVVEVPDHVSDAIPQPAETANPSPPNVPPPATAGSPVQPSRTGATPSPAASVGPGKVEFLANKASWIIFKVDDGQEERVYVKGGKAHTVAFKEKLAVRLGSPSDITYRYDGREQRVESSSRDVKTLEFP
ncbi:peptidylprolyl isomerase [Desulfolutivibrio sulfoxidireducens]|uniref:peptidylprolyl isomerase n=1 Tax=Desulfolutivibrio sulfoxidireducens TaxID=2773299 RepID=UPI00159D8012|nr:peptidylprolyl isomerase [Desulfolutivibrio sulfoxidireducens]QLA16446.1 hypothetical protein GD605_10100 [Desulfolutivibrio sulfoxidireducens]QLA19673.1 hypothetical protein GD604_07960 [Desulfolutivibrio sulfoxidireducens]